jgi:hypothetical protein
MKPWAEQIIENPKIQGVVATSTTMSGIWTILGYINPILGSLGILAGLVLTWVMVCKAMGAVRINKLEAKRKKLEIQILEKKLNTGG